MRTPLNIKPASFEVAQRREASAAATEMGQGLVMELHSTMTYFFADSGVEIGKIAVYAPRTYKGWSEYVRTLDGPDSPYDPNENRDKA